MFGLSYKFRIHTINPLIFHINPYKLSESLLYLKKEKAMRKAFLAILAVLILSVPGAAWAQNVGYDGGFLLQNDDGSFKLKVNGLVQPKYFFVKQSSGVVDPDNPPNFLPTKQSSFSVRRAEIKFTTIINEKLHFRFKIKHATNSANFSGVNASGVTLSYSFMPEFTMTAGMVGLPLDIMGDTSAAWLLMNEPPITSTQTDGVNRITPLRSSFGAPDGLGLNFSGEISKFFYALSVVNGAESNYTFNPNMRISAGTRLGVNILDPVPGSQTDFECSSKPKLATSVGFNYSSKRIDPNTGANISYIMTSSVGVALRWGGFSLNTEGYWRRTKLTSIGTALWARPVMDDIGYYASVGYYLIPQTLEMALQGGQIIREGPDNNSHEVTGGLNWYIFDNNLKMQFNFTWSEDFDDIFGQANNNIWTGSVMASAIF